MCPRRSLIPSLSEGNGPGLFVSSATVPNPLSKLRSPVWCWLASAAAIGAFLWIVAQFYLPGKGFTFFADVRRQDAGALPARAESNQPLLQRRTVGLRRAVLRAACHAPAACPDPALAQALDSLPYRARRILLSWTAWLMGWGRSSAGAACVLGSECRGVAAAGGAVVAGWFPPTNLRKISCAGAGCCQRGPDLERAGRVAGRTELLLIAGGVALAEAGRPWWSAVVLVFPDWPRKPICWAGAALAPAPPESRRNWRGLAGRAGVLVAAALGVWLVCLWNLARHSGPIRRPQLRAPVDGLSGQVAGNAGNCCASMAWNLMSVSTCPCWSHSWCRCSSFCCAPGGGKRGGGSGRPTPC